jgi:hypothetical protein
MPTEGAEFIEAGDVIEMLVGVEDGIDGCDFFAKGLLSEIWSAIDEEAPPGAC